MCSESGARAVSAQRAVVTCRAQREGQWRVLQCIVRRHASLLPLLPPEHAVGKVRRARQQARALRRAQHWVVDSVHVELRARAGALGGRRAHSPHRHRGRGGTCVQHTHCTHLIVVWHQGPQLGVEPFLEAGAAGGAACTRGQTVCARGPVQQGTQPGNPTRARTYQQDIRVEQAVQLRGGRLHSPPNGLCQPRLLHANVCQQMESAPACRDLGARASQPGRLATPRHAPVG